MINKKLVFIILAFILIIPFGIYLFASSKTAVSPEVAPVPTEIISNITPYTSQLTLMQSVPPSGSVLVPGNTQTFSFTFSSPLPTQLSASILLSSISSDITSPVKADISISTDRKTVIFTSKTSILPSSTYTVVIAQKGKSIFTTTYLSERISNQPVSQTDESLAKYLPYQTDTYTLSYSKTLGSYVFHLILEPNNPNSFQSQFETAQAAAKAYIQSKGINPDTLIIDWRHS